MGMNGSINRPVRATSLLILRDAVLRTAPQDEEANEILILRRRPELAEGRRLEG
jgi:hypothetical protein